MAKEGIKGTDAVLQHYKTICGLVDGDISAEVISTDFKDMVAEGKKLASIHHNIVVKVPMTKDGIKPSNVCTCPLGSILGLLKHPLTDLGLTKFLEDAKQFA